MTVHAGSVQLPVRTEPTAREALPDLGEAWSPPPLDADVVAPLERGRVGIERAADQDGTSRVDVVRNLGTRRIKDVGIELTALGSETYTVKPGDPTTARAVARRTARLERDGWRVQIETESTLGFADGDWQLESRLEATEGDAVVFARTWRARLPRWQHAARSAPTTNRRDESRPTG